MKPSAAPLPPMRVALYEGAGSHELPAAERGELLRTLLEKGFAVSCIRPGGASSIARWGSTAPTSSPQASTRPSAASRLWAWNAPTSRLSMACRRPEASSRRLMLA